MKINLPKITKLSEQSSILLDLIRATAAIFVFLTHLRYLFCIDFADLGVEQKNYFLKTFYFLTSIGHEAVMVFFVLSGYFIAGSIFRMREKNRWSWSDYALSRLTRLYMVLVPALIVGAFWDKIGPHLVGEVGLYSPHLGLEYKGMFLHPIAETATLRNWFGCLFFLQYIRCFPFGSNGPLWSLSYEFWYYVLFPLLLGFLYALSGLRKSLGIAVMNLALFMGILWFVGPGLRAGFLVWLFGAGVCLLPAPASSFLRSRAMRYAALILFIGVVVLVKGPLHSLSVDMQSLVIGFCFAAFLYFCVHGEVHTIPAFAAKIIRFLANISYSLYLFHVPFLVFLNVLIFKNGNRWYPDASHLFLLILVTILTFGYATVLWRLTEANTDIVRKKLGPGSKQPLSVTPKEAGSQPEDEGKSLD